MSNQKDDKSSRSTYLLAFCLEIGCTRPLYSRHELEDQRCNRCTDRLINHANERSEWNYYHK